ncbi:DMT family transporter [Asticcacaulis sp. BYS171W]|uniref:DMT family transporter n=1 Tax=Asticcacaulis aquaticus TaxID=2984212 RepID=A0ABT5HQB7_9CAUL|nr:DMT family transporter [Asticcacaulis aquaticus]MDC7682244.1 DMT family transporter [Asticcacaulis aquaticus]
MNFSTLNVKTFFQDRTTVFLSAVLCCLLWGSAFPAIKVGYQLLSITRDQVPSQLLFAGWRFVIAGLLLLIFAQLTGRPVFRLTRQQAFDITVLGLIQTAIQYVFFYIGLAHATGVKSSIMNATGAFFSVVLAHVLYRNDRLTPLRTLGCLIGFAGVMVVNFKPGALDMEFSLLGEGFVVIAAFILSAASIYGKKLSQTVDAVVMTGWQLGIGGAILAITGAGFGGHMDGMGLPAMGLLVYMGILSAVAFCLWGILLKYNPVGLVAAFQFLIPVFGVTLSALFLGESIWAWKNALSLVLVCAGIWLVTRSKPA